jgi:AcrR family transcriptional regulator
MAVSGTEVVDRQSALRMRKRRAVQDEVMRVAMRLFSEQGYDATTVEQIATAAGLSVRSFFRYFEGKDAVMTHAFATTGAEITLRLAERPADEGVWTALRRAFDGLVDQLTREDNAVRVMRMIYGTPALYASHLHKQAHWSEAIADTLAPRLSGALDDHERQLRAGALASAAVSCLEVARAKWVAGEGSRPLGEMIDDAMAAVAPLRPS